MYLSKLRIFGFKSFANKVEVNFPGEGITSVVGPNGCGKSNIIDAIRWVLGEQKAKALRSTKMEDVIFSGTAEKQALNLAEVSLIINNDKGLLPSEYAQVMITRRAYRNGDSEYLLNNQPCRLKDIHNLFYDTGMGAASYSLIEAKMIDSILSDKAEERRVMFEEASGISKYKQQRKETLRQLERTALDMTRVEDNLRHIQQNVNMFEKQAKRAEKWRDLKKASTVLELTFQFDAYHDFKGKHLQFKSDWENSQQRVQTLQNQMVTFETHLEERKLLILSEEQALQTLNIAVSAAQAELMQNENEFKRVQDKREHVAEGLARLENELQQIAQRLKEIDLQKIQAQMEKEKLAQDRDRLNEIATDQGEARQRVHTAYQDKRRNADELSEQRVSMLEDLSSLRNKVSKGNSELQHLQASEEELENSFAMAEQKQSAYAADQSLLQTQWEKAEKALREIGEALRISSDRLKELSQEKEALRLKSREKEREKVAAQTQFKLLKGLEESHEGVDGGAQYLLKNQNDKIKSLLADALKVPEASIAAVEKCLGRFLQALWVENPESAAALLDELRQGEKGEAAIFTARGDFKRIRPDWKGKAGFQSWLIDSIDCEANLKPLLELLLGHVAQVTSFTEGQNLIAAAKDQDLWCIAPDGEMLHACGLSLGGKGKHSQGGLLQRKAQLQQLGGQIQVLETDLLRIQSDFEKCEEESKSLQLETESLLIGQKANEKLGQEAKSKLSLLQNMLNSAGSEREQAEVKLKWVRERLSELQSQNESLSEQLEESEEVRTVLENQFRQALEAVHAAEEEKAQFEDQIRHLEKNRSENEAQSRSLVGRAEYLERSEKEQHGLIEKHKAQNQEWTDQIAGLEEKKTEWTDKIEVGFEKLGAVEKQRDIAKADYDEKASVLEELRMQMRHTQEEMRELTAGIHNSELKMQQAKAAMAGIRERMFEWHEVDFENEELNLERVEYNIETVDEDIRSLKEKLKNLGNINTGALEEYETEKLRLDEVQKQFQDLENARLGLEKAIKRLDKVAREQFLKTFATVQANFQEVFSSLFEGGEAQLNLEESEDPLDAKIEINARPTGKKMRGVALLSGGERALTAISLLFALYLVRPSPYCIMDEVDGPLDDANIGRFVNLLRRFSHQTQFIVVTHNKRTMAASDMLYGVTQEIKGISKLVSVQLDEASRIAA